LIKIHPVRANLFHAGGRKDEQTDVTKLIIDFRNIVNGPKKQLYRLTFWE